MKYDLEDLEKLTDKMPEIYAGAREVEVT